MHLESRRNILFLGVVALGFVTLAAIFLGQPLYDPDVWWHLKTGELIAKSKSLLPGDPFGFAFVQGEDNARAHLILDGYWLWQVAAYGFYLLGGIAGVFWLKALTLAAMWTVIGCSFWKNRVRLTIALPLAALGMALSQQFYYLERPAVWTFVFTAALVGFFVRIRCGAQPSRWLYPLMAVWGNVHGGVIVGAALLALFACGSWWDLREDVKRRWLVVRWAVLGIGLSFLNPVGIDFYIAALQTVGQGVADKVSEYRSTFQIFAGEKQILLVWALMLVHLWALAKGRRETALSDWLTFLPVVLMSLFYVRNIPFVFVSFLPMTGYLLDRRFAAEGKPLRCWEGIVPPLVTVVLVVQAVLAVQKMADEKRSGSWQAVSAYYPAQLVEFLRAAPLRGNIFNNYDWGGYLAWNLWPKYRFFIDTRALNGDLVRDYHKIVEGSLDKMNGQYEYEYLLGYYNIDVVVMNTEVEGTGVSLLLKNLLNKEEWQPIYQDWQSCVLVRSTGQSASLLGRHKIDKLKFLQTMLKFYDDSIRETPKDHRRYLGRGELLGYLGRYAEAERDFAMVRQLDPGNPYLPAKVRQLEKLRVQAKAKP